MKLTSLFGQIRGSAGRHPTPVAYTHEDGTMIGHDGSAWLWRTLPMTALHWEDRPARADVARKLHALLLELGRTSRGGMIPGSKLGAFARQFHMIALWWDTEVEIPDSTPQPQKEWLSDVVSRFYCHQSLFAIGVALRRSTAVNHKSLFTALRQTVADATGGPPDPMTYAADRALISGIIGRAGGSVPTLDEMRQMETWWNGGRETNSVLVAEPDGRTVSCDAWPEGLEIMALVDYEDAVLEPQSGLWIAEAFGHPEGCVAVSIRGETVPAKYARDLMRKSRRKALSRELEQRSSGDLDREEDYEFIEMSETLEQMFATSGEPLLRNLSIVFARKASATDNTFADNLSSKWGLQIKTAEYRQIETLEEMLPCSQSRLGYQKPFAQDATLALISESGISSFAKLGDHKGAWIGLAIPDMSPVWLNPRGASETDRPPAMAVLGEPGAGKTFLLQLIATQAALGGLPTVYINPKPADSLAGFAEEIGGTVIRISALEKETGMLDPFRYTYPQVAAEIAIDHITAMLTDLGEEEEIRMGAAMRRAADQGARCVGDALNHPDMPERARMLINAQIESSTLFGLGISPKPRPPLSLPSQGGLTLIEFDRPIDLPTHAAALNTLPRQTRAAVAAVRLVIRSSLEQMLTLGGGVLIADEAHVFLSSQEGRSMLQRLGREGRSQQILPILATQRIADVIAEGVDMTSYLSRQLVMKMTDQKEVEASLDICGLEITEERREWLANAGPIRGQRGALALHRDLNGECSAMLIGPIPDHVQKLFSTNPLDRQQRAKEQKVDRTEALQESMKA